MHPLSPLELERMASRIERLQNTRTHGWHPGDELEFKNQLPTSRVMDPRFKLPDPKRLRDPEQQKTVTLQDYQHWNQRILRMEGLIRDNDPRNPRKMIRDMQRGRFPRF